MWLNNLRNNFMGDSYHRDKSILKVVGFRIISWEDTCGFDGHQIPVSPDECASAFIDGNNHHAVMGEKHQV